MRILATRWTVIPAVLALATMLGCQGVSTGSPNNQQPSSSLVLGSSNLDFGTVSAGTSKTLTVSATNSGDASVTINSVSFSTSKFSLSAPSLPVTIRAGQSATLSLVFSPDAAGSFSATATVSSDASNPSVILPLSGTGGGAGQATLSPPNQSFSPLPVGSTHSQGVTLTNNGTSSITISSATISGSGFQLSGITTPLTVNASKSTSFTVTFAPQTVGSLSGTVTITSNASNPSLTMPLAGTGIAPGTLGLSATSLGFGSVQVGSNKVLSEIVTNTGGASVTISQISQTGAGFAISGITAPVTLIPGQAASFSVTFTPTSAAAFSGNISIASNGSNPSLSIPLSGTGTTATVGTLAVNPTSMNVGNVVVGSSGTGSGTLSASGASVTVSAASSNNSRFSVSGLSLPATIPAGQSIPFTVTFSPLVTGAASATLTFTSNASPGTTTEALSGTGTAASTHTVDLSWTASTSANITGYNIYRAVFSGTCGSYTKINSALNTDTTYTDSTVTNGVTYCYAATAVNSTSEESAFSNVDQAVVP